MECLGCRGELRRVRRSKASWVVVGVDLLLPSRVARLNFASRRRSVKRAGTSTVGRSARIPQIRVVALQSIGGLQERADFSASWSPLLKSQAHAQKRRTIIYWKLDDPRPRGARDKWWAMSVSEVID